jgi:hypothetical protein
MVHPVAQAVVVATATPLPSITPQVIKETVTQIVPQGVPPIVVQAVQFAAVFASALVLSVIHRVLEWATAREQGWKDNFNRLLATGYSLGVAVVGTAGMHQLGLQVAPLLVLAVNACVALAGSFWTYEIRKLLGSLTGYGTSVSSLPGVSLATDTTTEG